MVERIIEFCARRRAVVFIGVAFALAGAIFAIRRIKLDAIPDLSDPQVIVFTEWMGRSPPLIEDQVTYPIVSGLISTPKVVDVRGVSMFGMSFIYVVFDEGTDIYWARSRVLEYLSTIRGRLPEGVTPQIGPDATGIGWVFQYVLEDRSGKHGLDELRAFQDFNLRYAVGSVPGVAEVASLGGYEKQYQVTVDPDKLRAFGVTLEEVSARIRDSNADVGGRVLEMSGREYYVRGRGYVENLGDLAKIVLRTSGPSGVPVTVGDVGTVRFGPDIRRGLLEWNGEGEAVGAIVVMRYGENALDVIDRVKHKLDEIRPTLPEGVSVKIAYDRSALIHRSIDTLRHALLEEAITVALVIILFLLHLRSAMLPILSLPVAVAIAFIPMYFLDIPSTIMSLGGIAIAIGATVDAEIVMIEASHKKLEHAPPGADRHKLLAEAAREVTPAIFFALVIIAVAFLPVFSLTGQAGRLFKPLAYTKTFVMLAAALLSITFAPALRDALIRGKIRPESRHPVSRFLIAIYRPFVWVALRRPKTTVAIGLLAMASAVPLALRLGHEFMPPLDEGDVLYMPITFPNVSIEEAKRQLQTQDRILRSFPEVESVFGKVGRSSSPTDPAPLTMVETTVRLKPKAAWRKKHMHRWYSSWAPGPVKAVLRGLWPEERTMTRDEITTQMNARMQIPGWTNAWTMPIKTRVDMLSTGIRTPIGIKIYGSALDDIEQAGKALERVLTPIPGTRSVLYERNLGGLYIDIIPDRDAIARYGVSVGDVERTIEAAIGGNPIGFTIEGRKRFSINVRYPQDLRSDLERLRQVLVPLPGDGGGGGGAARPGMRGDLEVGVGDRPRYAQNMPMGGGGGAADTGGGRLGRPAPRPPATLSDASGADMGARGGSPGGGANARSPAAGGGAAAPGLPGAPAQRFVPLGQLATIKIAAGPPMLRDEGGMLVGYVYVDIDQDQRDLGGYVDDAKQVVARALASGELHLAAGSYLKWTGQYEQLAEMTARMKIAIPLTLLLIFTLLFFHFGNIAETLIVLLSIPFALVGSVWLMWLLDYRVSTAVWVGVIALVGLAAQTGIVMIVYIDNAYRERKQRGEMRDLGDIVAAHMEGTVQRVRPKLMTVATMLVGLVPLLWATGSGADVMKRIAAPMVGGLLTSAFLTLELIPVISTYWRQEQLMLELLSARDPARRTRTRVALWLLGIGAFLGVALAVVSLYVNLPSSLAVGGALASVALQVGGLVDYLALRPGSRRTVWPRIATKELS
jgi:copper/silver efflux system protein